MPHTSLLGHLVRQFVGGEENVATEALNYILMRSSVARRALIQLVAQASGVELGYDLTFKTQELGQARALPDLIGFNQEGQRSLIIEAKFWASLTPNQPVTYIESLPPDAPGAVVFLAPTQRFNILWSDLLRRCHEAKLETREFGSTEDSRSVRLPPQRALTLISWRRLLGVLVRDLEAAGEMELAADANQLLGLCEQMDGSAFVSLPTEGRAAEMGDAIRQHKPLIEHIVSEMVKQGVGKHEDQRTGQGEGWYGCYVNVGRYLFLVSVDERHQASYANTPFWLSLYRAAGRPLLKSDRVKIPQPCLFVKDQFGKDHCLVPLFPPAEAGQDEVVRQLVKQIRTVEARLYGRPSKLEAD